MNKIVIDSSCWLEYFKDTETGKVIAPFIKDIKNAIMPTITICEVFK